MGLRVKVASVVALSCALVAVAVGVIGYRSTEVRLVDEVDRSLAQFSALLVAARGNERLPARVLGDVYSARQLSVEGEVVRTNFVVDLPVDGPAIVALTESPEAARFDSQTSTDGERFRVLTVVVDRAVVQVARPLAETDSVLDDLRRRTLLLVALTTLAGALVGWLVAGRIAAPLRRLAHAADSVESSGDLDVDLGPDVGGDEVGRLRRSFGSMLAALSRSRAEQQRLVQDAGHELRTPLTSLRTNLGVLRRHRELPEDLRAEILTELESEVDELSALTDELVAAAQGVHADETPIEVDVAAVAATVAERVARRRGRTIDVRVPESEDGSTAPEPSIAIVAPLGVARAISNLVDNACKFDGTGGPVEVRIDHRLTPTGRWIAVRVLDRGPGVADADLPRVFHRFHRSEATRTMPGSGLGLAIVRDMVEQAGGAVVAANRPGGGAEIGFDLPSAAGGTADLSSGAAH